MSNPHPIFENIISEWRLAQSASQLPQPPSGPPLKSQDKTAGTDHAIPSRMFNRRAKLIEYHGNNRATFQCEAAGHKFRMKVLRNAPGGRKPSDTTINLMVRWWRNGVYVDCPKCRR